MLSFEAKDFTDEVIKRDLEEYYEILDYVRDGDMIYVTVRRRHENYDFHHTWIGPNIKTKYDPIRSPDLNMPSLKEKVEKKAKRRLKLAKVRDDLEWIREGQMIPLCEYHLSSGSTQDNMNDIIEEIKKVESDLGELLESI